MTSYVVGLCACLLIGGLGSLGFTVPGPDTDIEATVGISRSTIVRAVWRVSDTPARVETGVSGALNVPYVATIAPYTPRHAAWLKPPVGIARHDGTGRVHQTTGDDRLEPFYAQMRAYA